MQVRKRSNFHLFLIRIQNDFCLDMFISNAVRTNLKENVRAYTLCGQVLAKEASSLDKARAYLEKALVFNPKHTDAVIALVDVYSQLKQQQKTIEL